MTMKLYYLPGACSLAPHTALEWAHAKYEAVAATPELIKSPAYLAKNPQGQVPLLEMDNGWTLSENVAIMEFISKRYPGAYLFGSGDEYSKAKAYQWLLFCNADVHKQFGFLFGANKMVSNKEAQDELRAFGTANILKLFATADEQLQKSPYLSGEKTVADAYMNVLLNWAKALKIDISSFKALPAYHEKMLADAGVKAAMKMQGLI